MKEKIDFVITWVDNQDEKWQKDREKYTIQEGMDNRPVRYRDMGTLKYWFRGVEKFAPWVNKIYFITYGHLPKWLNTNNEKIVIVNHKDYIPSQYLPTFNSDTIELNMHKIKDLQEKFVYFNDDMFLINKVQEKDFFKNGLPCDCMSLEPIIINPNDDFYKKICNNMEIINRNFKIKQVFKENKQKFLSFKQRKYLFRTISLLNYTTFLGFHNFHMPIAYLKSTFEEVWTKEKESLKNTMKYRFRDNKNTINHWVFQYWQFAKGSFYQRDSNIGQYIKIYESNLQDIIKKQKYKMICINDYEGDFEFEEVKRQIQNAFEKILPEKSTFEI